MVPKIPTYDICNLLNSSGNAEDFVLFELQQYIVQQPEITFPHRHSFYQVLYIHKGHGCHIIDFETYPVKDHMMFFISPGQIHEWKFDRSSKGILINFNDIFFSSFLANPNYINEFGFFLGPGGYSAAEVVKDHKVIEFLLEHMKREFNDCRDCSRDMIRTMLLQLLIFVSRHITGEEITPVNKQNYFLLKSFQKLIEQYYTLKKLPKDYAEMLFITPNYLNALCNELTGKSAGEMIRNRIILEAKRLLIHSPLSVSEIAWKLKFESNSYFSKFFKKYAGITPEQFRKSRIRLS